MSSGEREEGLVFAFSTLNNSEEIREFLQELLSPTEFESIAKRWCIARRLFNGQIQSDARELCNTSKAMVTRVNRMVVRDGNGMCNKVHQRLNELGMVVGEE